MSPVLSRKLNGKKYMWDGTIYRKSEQAEEAIEAYERDGFEVELIIEGDWRLIYTRRAASVQTGA